MLYVLVIAVCRFMQWWYHILWLVISLLQLFLILVASITYQLLGYHPGIQHFQTRYLILIILLYRIHSQPVSITHTSCIGNKHFLTAVQPKGAARLQPHHQNEIKKDTMISNILCDLPFSWNQLMTRTLVLSKIQKKTPQKS